MKSEFTPQNHREIINIETKVVPNRQAIAVTNNYVYIAQIWYKE